MAWRTKIQKPVSQILNALRASDQLSRRGLIRANNAVRLELPKHARRFQAIRYIYDPYCLLHTVNFPDKRAGGRCETCQLRYYAHRRVQTASGVR